MNTQYTDKSSRINSDVVKHSIEKMILEAVEPLSPPTLKKQYIHGVSQSV